MVANPDDGWRFDGIVHELSTGAAGQGVAGVGVVRMTRLYKLSNNTLARRVRSQRGLRAGAGPIPLAAPARRRGRVRGFSSDQVFTQCDPSATGSTMALSSRSTNCSRLLRVDAVGIERRHRVATRLLVVVGALAKPEHRVVNPLWRIELASDEGERIERARH
jgi:hypothetical protein